MDAVAAAIRAEQDAAERLVARVRLVVIAAVLVLQAALAAAGVADLRSLVAGFGVGGFAAIYGLVAWWILRRGSHPRLAVVTTALDLLAVAANCELATRDPAWATKAPAALAFFLVIGLAGLRQRPRLALLTGVGAAIAYLALLVPVALAAPWSLTGDVRRDFGGPDVAPVRMVTVAALLLLASAVTAATARRTRVLVARAVDAGVRRQALLSAMERYFPEREALAMIESGRELARGGERRLVTVLTSDIRGFTTLSESLEAAAVVGLLNDYFEAMVEAVFEHDGTLLSFAGDGLYAVFGLPAPKAGDATRAVAAARSMLARLDALNAGGAFAAAGPGGLRIGIALHTGEVLAGSIGSRRRLEYTVIGDTVNAVARLEGLNRELGTVLLVSETTLSAAGGDPGLEDLGEVALRGRAAPLRVHGLRLNAPAQG